MHFQTLFLLQTHTNRHTSLGPLAHFTARLETMNHDIKFMRRIKDKTHKDTQRHTTHTHTPLFFSHCWPDCNLIVLSTPLFPFIPLLFLSHLSSCPPFFHSSIICHDSEWMKTKRRGIRLHGSSCPACHFLHPHCLCPVVVHRQLHWNKWSQGSCLI